MARTVTSVCSGDVLMQTIKFRPWREPGPAAVERGSRGRPELLELPRTSRRCEQDRGGGGAPLEFFHLRVGEAGEAEVVTG